MKRPLFGFLALLWFLSFSLKTNAQYEFLLNKNYAQRYRLIDSLFYYTPFLEGDSSVLRKVEEISKLARHNNDKELLMETELIRATYYTSGRQSNVNAVEPMLAGVIRDALRLDDKPTELRARQFLARFYIEEQNKFGPALDQLVRSYYLIKDLDIEEFPNKKAHVYNVAAAYYNYGDYDNAKKYLLEADRLSMPPTTRKYEKAILMNVQNTLGLLHRKNGNYDSARHYFLRAYDIAKQEHDTTWMGIANGNIGIGYFMQGKYEEAIPLLEEDIEMSFKAHEYDNAINSLIKLAEIRLEENDLESVEREINRAVDSLKFARDPLKHKLGLFPLIARLAEKRGNIEAAYRYADSALIIKDSMMVRQNAIALARTEQKIAAEKYSAELERANTEKKLHTLTRNGLIIGILLLGVIGLLFTNRMRMKHIRDREQLTAKRNIAELELKVASEQLEMFTRHIREKNEMIERISIEIEKMKSRQDDKRVEELNNVTLTELRRSTILTEDQWEEFRNVFEHVHSGYLYRMKEKYPGLSPADIRFMVLNKLKFTGKEMERILGVGSEAIRQNRYRLRKKLALSEEANLQDIAETI